VKILYLGDVVGRSGRDAICARMADYRRDFDLDLLIVNGENAASGFGITEKICTQFFDAGTDVIVTGNHVWDQKDIISTFETEKRLIRPLNFPAGTPGNGSLVIDVGRNRKALILQVMGRVFMDPLDDPFAAVDNALKGVRLGDNVAFIMVDVHGEATSEKMAFGHFLDGRVSMVVGTHTHVPTSDHQILPGGTAYQSDVGMCGDYDSVIGMDKAEPVRRFTRKMPGGRFTPALGEATVCGVYVETDDKTGLATKIEVLREGGRLSQERPAV
jgi:2',3'-cyclic-nucleotide 2'-phosphodiesterase